MDNTRSKTKRLKSINKCSSSESRDDDDAKKESCKGISKVLASQDLIIDILSRLPVECLLNSARYVCKSWATLLASSHFALAHLDRSSSHQLCFFAQNFMSHSKTHFLHIKEKDNLNGPFQRTHFGMPPLVDMLTITYDGMMLLYNHSLSSFFLVNPIHKCCFKIPPLPPIIDYFGVCRQLTVARLPHTAKFKLFFVELSTSLLCYVFYVLNIGTDNSWKEIARKEANYGSKLRIIRPPVYGGNNNLYWITIEGVIMVDVDKEIIIREFPLPSPPMVYCDHPPLVYCDNPHPHFLWMGSCLSSIVRANYKRFQIYILDIDLGKWSLYHEMGPLDYWAALGLEFKRYEFEILDVCFLFWINDQVIFRVCLKQEKVFPLGPNQVHFCYNVKTKHLTKIESIGLGSWVLWLHNNSLLSFPTAAT